MTDKLVSVNDIVNLSKSNSSMYLKYVRIGEEYRFAFAEDYFAPNHVQMVEKGEKAVSAAYIDIRWDKPIEIHDWSSTLKLGPALDDYEKIPELFRGLYRAYTVG